MGDLIKMWQAGISFALVPNICIEDPNISGLAKGIYTYIVGKPDGWEMRPADMLDKFKESKNTIYKGINELIDHGYIHRFKEYLPGRRGVVKFHYVVSYKPMSEEQVTNLLPNQSWITSEGDS